MLLLFGVLDRFPEYRLKRLGLTGLTPQQQRLCRMQELERELARKQQAAKGKWERRAARARTETPDTR